VLAVVAACLALPVFILVRTFGVQLFSMPSSSMEPSLLIGDYFIVNKAAYGYTRFSLPFSLPLFSGRILAADPRRGDLVVFRLPRDASTDYVKRVVGLPGDRVQMRGGVLYINGTAAGHERLADFDHADGVGNRRVKRWRETLAGASYETLDLQDNGPFDNTQEFTVPAGHYFVLGDNRDNSLDSRMQDDFGYIPADYLVGRVAMIVYSVAPGGQFRDDRIGLTVR
jgi:signal peptidase I